MKVTTVLKALFIMGFMALALSCDKGIITPGRNIEISQTVSNGAFIQSVNGKNLTCKVEQTSIDAGKEVVLICTNEIDCDATITVSINSKEVGTINSFPAEFRYKIDDTGIYQFSIVGKLSSKNSLVKFETSFAYSWSITVSE